MTTDNARPDASLLPRETAGQKFSRLNPDWPHDCCYPQPCPYRERHADKHMMCASPIICEYMVPVGNKGVAVAPIPGGAQDERRMAQGANAGSKAAGRLQT